MSTLASENRLNGLRVLVVEDEGTIYSLIEDTLKKLGCGPVWRAVNVETGLSQLVSHKPDIAILDVNLVGEPVYPIALRLDELGIPIVFSTAYARTIPAFWNNRPIVEKPFSPAILATALRKALNSRPDARP